MAQAFFLPGHEGQRFCLYHPAQGAGKRGAVLYLHPFAEEMNKSRRMAAMQARMLAEAGYAVLQIDFLGCGDSSGDFSDATWQAWREDAALGYRWLRDRADMPPILWGLRAGCLIAVAAANEIGEAANFVFWQPVASGKQLWQQFMRLKMAGELVSGRSQGITEQLRAQLAAGQPVEIAGYSVSPALASGLEAAELKAPSDRAGRVAWYELSQRDDAGLTPAAQRVIEQWQAAGYQVASHVVRGPQFWQTAEIEDAPQLLHETLAALESWQ